MNVEVTSRSWYRLFGHSHMDNSSPLVLVSSPEASWEEDLEELLYKRNCNGVTSGGGTGTGRQAAHPRGGKVE